ncbi:MAG: hypothetical protein GY696_12210, partial [Gammaproteobacteria bacterium]|nr:hypothetical protein [Gammaproteobacteria bacterium]
MKIEFFSDKDSVCNVRFPGDRYASNEVILGIFYDNDYSDLAQIFFEDCEKLFDNKLSEAEQNDYEFGDFIGGEMRSDYSILKPEDCITSK